MPRASRAKVAKVPPAELAACTPSEPLEDEVPAVNLLKKLVKFDQSKKPKAIQPIMSSINEVLRELEERRAKPIDVKELKVDEMLSKFKTLREKVQAIFGTCVCELEDLQWSLG